MIGDENADDVGSSAFATELEVCGVQPWASSQPGGQGVRIPNWFAASQTRVGAW